MAKSEAQNMRTEVAKVSGLSSALATILEIHLSVDEKSVHDSLKLDFYNKAEFQSTIKKVKEITQKLNKIAGIHK